MTRFSDKPEKAASECQTPDRNKGELCLATFCKYSIYIAISISRALTKLALVNK